jgi:hypothetical protein
VAFAPRFSAILAPWSIDGNSTESGCFSHSPGGFPPQAQEFMAKRMGSVIEEIDGSHTSFIAQPVRAAAFIKTALT